jgi:hypothetical protein
MRGEEVVDITIDDRIAGSDYWLPSWRASTSQHHRI